MSTQQKNEKSETSVTELFVDIIVKMMEQRPDHPADYFDRLCNSVLEGSLVPPRKAPEYEIPPPSYKVRNS